MSIFGGEVVIQVKRYNNTVGISAVRDLFGTLQNQDAPAGKPCNHFRLRAGASPNRRRTRMTNTDLRLCARPGDAWHLDLGPRLLHPPA